MHIKETTAIAFPAISLPGTKRPEHLPAPFWRIFVAQKHIMGDYTWAEGDYYFSAVLTTGANAETRLQCLEYLLDPEAKGFNLQEVVYADEEPSQADQFLGACLLVRDTSERLNLLSRRRFDIDLAMATPALVRETCILWKRLQQLTDDAESMYLAYKPDQE